MSDVVARRRSPGAILAVVGFGVFIAADDLMVVTTMLRPIIDDLGLKLPDGLDDAAWIVNVYLIAFVAIMPIAGRLSDLVGRRRTFMASYLVFLAGTILIPLSVSFDSPFRWFLVGRVLTAIGGGAMLPVALAVVGDAYEEGRRARALGSLGAIETLGWVWGPLYGAMLVRFLSWEWQFWLNVPLALAGMAATWLVLDGHDAPAGASARRLDLLGAGLLTTALVSFCVGVLGPAEIQSVNGLDELTGGSRDGLRWFLVPAVIATIAFVWWQRRCDDPILDPALLRGRAVRIALFVTFVIGAALVIVMVDTPLFVNAIETDVERAAVASGWILSALTAAMAVTSYVGGRFTERTWVRPPVLLGTALAAAAFLWMGLTWDPDIARPVQAVQLAILGAGFGLTFAPTTAAVVDAAPADRRGAAAAVVMVVRLLGLSVGLAALTAWALARFEALRGTLELPPITDPAFADAVLDAQGELTAQSIAETFLAAVVVALLGCAVSILFRRSPQGDVMTTADSPATTTAPPPPPVPVVGPSPASSPADSSSSLRTIQFVVSGLAVLIVVLAVIVGVLIVRLDEARDGLVEAEAGLLVLESELTALGDGVTDLVDGVEDIEGGVELAGAQLSLFQEALGSVGPELTTGLDDAIAGLAEFRESTLSFNVPIDEEIPISAEFAIQRDIVVPINTSVPINQTISTSIEVDGPFGLTVPVDVNVPVDIEIPIDLDVTIPVDEVVPIEQTIPVQVDVPIVVDVGDTELVGLADSIIIALESVRDGLGAFAVGG